MARYGAKFKKRVGAALHEAAPGTRESGKWAEKPTSGKQTIAIGLSKTPEEGGRAPSADSKRWS